ncbi:MAG TPA: hypothetical protein H9671_02695 [Firmicutes bacterium]|nr:hypothetical protein [Bacillota bacterium]
MIYDCGKQRFRALFLFNPPKFMAGYDGESGDSLAHPFIQKKNQPSASDGWPMDNDQWIVIVLVSIPIFY